MKELFEIFWVFFKIGMFTIGGGYAMLPIILKEVVDKKGWMENEEFLNAISLTNSLPGPLATNSATFIGYRASGIKGALVAILGTATPSVVIILIIAMLFKNITSYHAVQDLFSGIRPAVVALIVYSVFNLSKSIHITKELNWVIAGAGLLLILVLGVHPIVVIVLSALYGIYIKPRLVK